ncbi:lipopolysaccharide biosynthesis protein [Vibrio vulnificus]|uniref:lipopolysaccharide biosynthesis protein n=1 Tax=Vibrio vulnificus TaxID=672 RepID=UPI003F6723B4
MKNERILFISPRTHGYELDIENAIKNRGDCIYYDERPFTSSIGKIILRLNIRFLSKLWIDKYYKSIFHSVSKVHIDTLFLVIPESVPSWFIEDMRSLNSQMKIIIYMWDSFKNRKSVSRLEKYADKIFSFDKHDCEERGFRFLPLFYTDDFIQSSAVNKIYDFCFIGTVHSDRSKVVTKVSKCGGNNFIYWYCPSRLLFFLKKIFTNELKGIDYSDVNFHSLDKNEVSLIMRKSRVVIDIHHPGQSGLTMRTIESLGTCSKLVTTNADIVNYDFFNEDNCHIISRDASDIRIPSDFSLSEYRKVSKKIIESYHIDAWVNYILE